MSTTPPDSHSPDRLVKVQVMQTIEQVNAAGPMSAAAFSEFAAKNGRCELIDGKVKLMSPAGSEHGYIANEIAFLLTSYARAGGLGRVYAAETGFVVQENPDTVRAPDVAFIRSERLPEIETRGFGTVMPDLVFEVISPSETEEMIQGKTRMWLDAGVQAVVNVYAVRQSVQLHHGTGASSLTVDDVVDLSQIVDGWQPVVREFFGPAS